MSAMSSEAWLLKVIGFSRIDRLFNYKINNVEITVGKESLWDFSIHWLVQENRQLRQ